MMSLTLSSFSFFFFFGGMHMPLDLMVPEGLVIDTATTFGQAHYLVESQGFKPANLPRGF